ncbi:unnamed protein product [Rotaria sp. Silwood2]|nr:unnamed protein product [Rotaria sp. Silwood2]
MESVKPFDSFIVYNKQLWVSSGCIIYIFNVNNTNDENSYNLLMKKPVDDDCLITMLGFSGHICADEKEIEWRLKIQQKIGFEQPYDEKLNYLKSLQQYIANIPLYFYHLLCAINQNQPQFNKQFVSFMSLFKEKKKEIFIDF